LNARFTTEHPAIIFATARDPRRVLNNYSPF